MEVFNNRRSSSNFIQCITDDGSLDYSADWESFSFETEMNTRKAILEEDVKAYKKLLEQPTNNDNVFGITAYINELKTDKKLCEELLMENENIFSKYRLLIEEHKKVKENLQKLTKKNESLHQTIKDLKDDETASRKHYQQMKLALQKANEMYTTNFGIDVSIKALSDSTYEASVYFKPKDVPITFTVDRVNRTVLDFRCNEILSPNEEQDIRKEFGNLDNLPGLFCTLRNVILKK